MPHNNLPHPEMVTKSEEVRQVLTPELYQLLVSLIPTPERYSALHERFEDSVTGYLKGDPEKVKECEAARLDLNRAMTVVTGVGKVVSVIEPSIGEQLRLAQAQERSAVAADLGAIKDFKLHFDKDGRPYCSVAKLASAKGYEVWFAESEPSVDSNWKLLSWSTSCQKLDLSGLNRSRTSYIKVRGKRGQVLGPWSHFLVLNPA